MKNWTYFQGKLQCPEIGRNVASYDPHKGFLLNLKDSSLKKPEGIYLCIGSQNNENFRMMEYKLIPTNNNQSESGLLFIHLHIYVKCCFQIYHCTKNACIAYTLTLAKVN